MARSEPPSYAEAHAVRSGCGRSVSEAKATREGEGERLRLRTGQMRSSASGIGTLDACVWVKEEEEPAAEKPAAAARAEEPPA